jgi:hypothetical protein
MFVFNPNWIFQGLVLALLIGIFSILVLIFMILQDCIPVDDEDEPPVNVPDDEETLVI